MTTINGDHGYAGMREFNIHCKDALHAFIAFTDNPTMIVSGERNSDHPGGRLPQYHIAPDPASQINAPENLDAITLNGIDRAAVSKDGKWIMIISGASVMVRNIVTEEVVEVDEHTSGVPVHAVDIAPDSLQDPRTRQSAYSDNTGKLLKLSQHMNSVLGVKFCPNSDYLTTAAPRDSMRVWDTRDNYMSLRTCKPTVCSPAANAGTAFQSIPLGWSSHDNHVFTLSSGLVTIFQSSSPTSPYMPYYER